MPRIKDTIGTHKTVVYMENGSQCVRYHATLIARLDPNGVVTLNTGGWHTVTTKRRMNECLRFWGAENSHWQVFQKKGIWYVSQYLGNGLHSEPVEFFDNMELVA